MKAAREATTSKSCLPKCSPRQKETGLEGIHESTKSASESERLRENVEELLIVAAQAAFIPRGSEKTSNSRPYVQMNSARYLVRTKATTSIIYSSTDKFS